MAHNAVLPCGNTVMPFGHNGRKPMTATEYVIEVLGGGSVFKGRTVPTSTELRERIKRGLPYRSLESVRERLRLSVPEAASVLHMPATDPGPPAAEPQVGRGRIGPSVSNRARGGASIRCVRHGRQGCHLAASAEPSIERRDSYSPARYRSRCARSKTFSDGLNTGL
jgi:hypothetical protein